METIWCSRTQGLSHTTSPSERWLLLSGSEATLAPVCSLEFPSLSRCSGSRQAAQEAVNSLWMGWNVVNISDSGIGVLIVQVLVTQWHLSGSSCVWPRDLGQ